MQRFANPVAFGATLIVAAMALIGLIDNFVGVIAQDIGLWQFHFLRSVLALPLMPLAVGALGLPLRPRRPGRVVLRALAQSAAMLFYFGSLPMMSIAQAGAGLFTAPLFVLLFSAALFGHRIGPRRMAAVAIGFCGVLLLLRPDFRDLSPALALPVGAGALYAVANILTREWCAEEPVAALLGSFFLVLGVFGAAGLIVLAIVPVPEAAALAAPFLTRPWALPSGAATF